VNFGNFSEAFGLFLCMWGEFNDGRSRTFTMIRASAGLGEFRWEGKFILVL